MDKADFFFSGRIEKITSSLQCATEKITSSLRCATSMVRLQKVGRQKRIINNNNKIKNQRAKSTKQQNDARLFAEPCRAREASLRFLSPAAEFDNIMVSASREQAEAARCTAQVLSKRQTGIIKLWSKADEDLGRTLGRLVLEWKS